tara:strand:+ start:2518 stop:2892 length:375 start_codon:yes stop_codon:yes gene_type:complete
MEMTKINFDDYKELIKFVKTTEITLKSYSEKIYKDEFNFSVSDIFQTDDGGLINVLNKVALKIYKIRGKKTAANIVDSLFLINVYIQNIINELSGQDVIEDNIVSGVYQGFNLTVEVLFLSDYN